MLFQLFLFEWKYHMRGFLFPLAAIAFLFFGCMFSLGGFRLPHVYANSPYIMTQIIGILSMGLPFAAMVFCAGAMLRDEESMMSKLIYTTPIAKWQFLSSRFAGALMATIMAFSFVVLGILISTWLPQMATEDLGAAHWSYYVWPLLIIAIPNAISCCSILFFFAILSRNRIILYLGALGLYLLYVISSMYAGAPWLAGVSPASADTISLMSKLDPFGLSAFFEQTQQWSASERNTQLLALTGNFAINRWLWLIISALMLLGSYVRFSFQQKRSKRIKKEKNQPGELSAVLEQEKQKTSTISLSPIGKGHWLRLRSCIQLEFVALIRQIPFLIMIAFWIVLVVSESMSTISGGIRLPDEYPTTAMLSSNLLDILPFFGTIVLIFFSNEILWRSRLTQTHFLIDSTPVPNWILFLSNYLVLVLIPLLLIVSGILICVVIQISRGYFQFEWSIYLRVFYYGGLPLSLVAVLALLLQSLSSNRYVGMFVTGLFLLLSSSPLSALLGIEHPLLRFAAPLRDVSYSDMNGFGAYATAFHWRMAYWGAWSILMGLLCFGLWQRGSYGSMKTRIKMLGIAWGKWGKRVALLTMIGAIGMGTFLFYEIPILPNQLDQNQAYEERYKSFQDLPQPRITEVFADVRLYPRKQAYEVIGSYVIHNKTDGPLEKALLFINSKIDLRTVDIDSASIQDNLEDTEHGHRWVRFSPALKVDEQRKMTFSFESSWSGFGEHTLANAIVENGSFIRMSRYFPRFGYQASREITSERERKKRGLPPYQSALLSLEEENVNQDSLPFDYEVIQFETIVSTEGDQIAISSGNLMKEWTEAGRNYFHYTVDRPIPFRFAYSSARYEVEKTTHKGIDIEVFYHPTHAYNVDRLIAATRQTLDYCTTAFGPYQYDHIRFAEVSEFTGGFAATAYPGTLYVLEDKGFLSDLRDPEESDLITQLVGHELSHQWWGGQLSPEFREGGIFLTESFAQYTELMVFEQAYGKEKALEALQIERELYLRDRGFVEEVPLYRAGRNHPHIPYSKGEIILYAIRELIGEDTLNQVLQSVLALHAYPNPPATALDFLEILRQTAPQELYPQLESWMTDILLYDLKIEQASAQQLANGTYEVELKLICHKTQEDGWGNASAIPINDYIQIGLSREEGMYPENLMSLSTYHFTQETTVLTIVVPELPSELGIDPYGLMIEENREDNLTSLK